MEAFFLSEIQSPVYFDFIIYICQKGISYAILVIDYINFQPFAVLAHRFIELHVDNEVNFQYMYFLLHVTRKEKVLFIFLTSPYT